MEILAILALLAPFAFAVAALLALEIAEIPHRRRDDFDRRALARARAATRHGRARRVL